MVSRQTVERARDLRRRLTPPEARLWVRLRREQLRELRFRRQHPVGPYVRDFYCAEAKRWRWTASRTTIRTALRMIADGRPG